MAAILKKRAAKMTPLPYKVRSHLLIVANTFADQYRSLIEAHLKKICIIIETKVAFGGHFERWLPNWPLLLKEVRSHLLIVATTFADQFNSIIASKKLTFK